MTLRDVLPLLLSSGVLMAALATTVGLAMKDPETAPPLGRAAQRQDIPPGTSRPVPAMATMIAFEQRPLFNPSRRPVPLANERPDPAPPPFSVPEPPPVPLAASLVGVVISPKGRSAILRLNDGTSRTIAAGESLQGWLLADVTPDHAAFRLATRERHLTFEKYGASADAADQAPAIPVPTPRRRR